MTSRTTRILAVLLTVALAALIGRSSSYPTAARFADGAPSIEVLLDRFVAALAAKDQAALERLRVDAREYETIILPGNVPVGKPPRELAPREREFAWSMLDTKSRYSIIALLDEFGGRHLKIKSFEFARGTERYAGFTAHRQLRLKLEDDAGGEAYLGTGSVAESEGTFKFVSFTRD
jgi:hypothetical protein